MRWTRQIDRGFVGGLAVGVAATAVTFGIIDAGRRIRAGSSRTERDPAFDLDRAPTKQAPRPARGGRPAWA